MGRTDGTHAGDIEVRPREHTVFVGDHEVTLSSREFEILLALIERPGWAFSAIRLSEESGRSEYSPDSMSVLVLRRKLAETGVPDAIETVRGVGYRLHMSKEDRDSSEAVADATRELRDASWRLLEAVIDVLHAATVEQQRAATVALERARRAIHTSLSKWLGGRCGPGAAAQRARATSPTRSPHPERAISATRSARAADQAGPC